MLSAKERNRVGRRRKNEVKVGIWEEGSLWAVGLEEEKRLLGERVFYLAKRQ